MLQSQNNKSSENGRKTAMGLGGAVYVGVIIAAVTLNITFILLAFPKSAFLTRAIMVLGCVLVGLSMVAFPVALHKWAVSGWHRWIAIFFYYGEMAIIAVNTIVSFSALMYKFAGASIPAWISWYEPYSIVSIVYVLIAWGTIFLTDPRARQEAKIMDARTRFQDEVAKSMNNYLDTQEGKASIQARANQLIQNHYSPLDQSTPTWNSQPMQGPAGGGSAPQLPMQPSYHPQNQQQYQQPQMPAQQAPGIFWNLAAWLNYIRMDGNTAYGFLASRGILNDGNPASAYMALQPTGYIPPEMQYTAWPGIYGELVRTYGPMQTSGPGYPVMPPPQFNQNQNPPTGSVR